jgi:hypothetical protein
MGEAVDDVISISGVVVADEVYPAIGFVRIARFDLRR